MEYIAIGKIKILGLNVETEQILINKQEKW